MKQLGFLSTHLVMHGKKDKIVPFHMGEQIFEKANEPKFSYFPDNDDHMMDYNEDLLKTLSIFFKTI